jgi:hypothetical protein
MSTPNKKNERGNAAKNSDRQAIDKAPGEEKRQAAQVTPKDLKGKKVDADPTEEKEKRISKTRR